MENINKKTVLVIDNYDSFTYNLVHLINEVGTRPKFGEMISLSWLM